MNLLRVFVSYQPKLYQDLLTKVLRTHRHVEVLETLTPVSPTNAKPVDVILVALEHQGGSDIRALSHSQPEAKILAFSPRGDYGFRRMPGESGWEKLIPFELSNLLEEMQAAMSSER